MTQFSVTWIDHKREPQCPPNPAYPNGIDVKTDAPPFVVRCRVDLPYPAKRCGAYRVECRVCGLVAAVTTAGRPDDPRSVELRCLSHTVWTA